MPTREALLETIRQAPEDQPVTKIDRLLTRFGFEKSEQANHMKYRHELLPTGAVVTVPRHRRVRGYVARSAVAAVDSVVAAEKAKAGANEEGSTQ